MISRAEKSPPNRQGLSLVDPLTLMSIKNLELRKPAYVGHSWGGNIGTVLASDAPDLISRAFLEDPVFWRMLHAFMTALPGALARRNKPEAEIRAEAKQKGLSQSDEDMEVYRNHHFSADALTRLLTDNRDWAFAFEDHLKRIAVPTMLLVADNKAAQPARSCARRWPIFSGSPRRK